jgi:hypothetical protein
MRLRGRGFGIDDVVIIGHHSHTFQPPMTSVGLGIAARNGCIKINGVGQFK